MAAYAAHWATHQKQNARLAALAAGMALFSKVPSKPPESSSRQDARIALLMRAEGYNKATVLDVIQHHAPTLRKDEKRDWRRYAARTAAYAFGLGGDMELVQMVQTAQVAQTPQMELKPMEEVPPPSKQHEEEAWGERPRLRMR